MYLDLGHAVFGKRTLQRESVLASAEFGSVKGRGWSSGSRDWFSGPSSRRSGVPEVVDHPRGFVPLSANVS